MTGRGGPFFSFSFLLILFFFSFLFFIFPLSLFSLQKCRERDGIGRVPAGVLSWVDIASLEAAFVGG